MELGRLGKHFVLKVDERGREALFTDLPCHVGLEKTALEEQKAFNRVG
jgi:hypothetical protein